MMQLKMMGRSLIKEILYFEIDGIVFYNGNFDNLISKEITFLSTYLVIMVLMKIIMLI